MKLRCTTNSIRLRLRKSELTQLSQAQKVSEYIHFPMGNKLHFALKITAQKDTVSADFQQGQLTVYLPQSMANQWINSNQVSIETNLDLNNSEQLHILVEKDFPCKDRDDEDKADTFQELAAEQEKDTC